MATGNIRADTCIINLHPLHYFCAHIRARYPPRATTYARTRYPRPKHSRWHARTPARTGKTTAGKEASVQGGDAGAETGKPASGVWEAPSASGEARGERREPEWRSPPMPPDADALTPPSPSPGDAPPQLRVRRRLKARLHCPVGQDGGRKGGVAAVAPSTGMDGVRSRAGEGREGGARRVEDGDREQELPARRRPRAGIAGGGAGRTVTSLARATRRCESRDSGAGGGQRGDGLERRCWGGGNRGMGWEIGNPRSWFVYVLMLAPHVSAGLRVRASFFIARMSMPVGHNLVSAPVPAGTSPRPYPRPPGLVPAGTQIFCARCHLYTRWPCCRHRNGHPTTLLPGLDARTS